MQSETEGEPPSKRARSDGDGEDELVAQMSEGDGSDGCVGNRGGESDDELSDSEDEDGPPVPVSADLRSAWVDLDGCETLDDVRRVVHARFTTSQQVLDYIQTYKDTRLLKIIPLLMQRPRRRLPHIHSLDQVCHLIESSKKILILTGAGVSVSAGIPDFRSTDGIYRRLRDEFGMPRPECMFDREYFDRNPQPFFSFAHELWPGRFDPTPCHRFIALLEKKGQLLRNYSQNIDTLEQRAGIERVVNCHGSFATATCVTCGHKCDGRVIEDDIMQQRIARCPVCARTERQSYAAAGPGRERESRGERERERDRVPHESEGTVHSAGHTGILSSLAPESLSEARPHSTDSCESETGMGIEGQEDESGAGCAGACASGSHGVLKPDIVFFKEALPTNFFASLRHDLEELDLLLVIGTSLRVAPVSDIVAKVGAHVPALLINREVVGQPHEFDVELLGDCDAVVSEICGKLGWSSDGIPATQSALTTSDLLASSSSCDKQQALVHSSHTTTSANLTSSHQPGPSRPGEPAAAAQGAATPLMVDDGGKDQGGAREESLLGGKEEEGEASEEAVHGSEEEVAAQARGLRCGGSETLHEASLRTAVEGGAIVQYGPCTYLFRGFSLAQHRGYMCDDDDSDDDGDERDDEEREARDEEEERHEMGLNRVEPSEEDRGEE